MAFNPKTTYDIVPDKLPAKHFHAYRELFVTRPPYQRKNVWSTKKKQALLDSLFRKYYVPKLVVREIRKDENETIDEVIDGQQRISTVQEFFNDDIKLPKSLEDLDKELPGNIYSKLPAKLRLFVDEKIKFDIDRIKGIDDRKNPEHQKIATEIFWRLQQGESLNFMEIAHAKLASLSRNFIVKYSDDISFDYEEYLPLETNKYKHIFFNLYDRDNDRMQHLMLMSRFSMIEAADGYAEVKDTALTEFIVKHEQEDGIGNDSYEKIKSAKRVLSNLDFLYKMFANDVMVDKKNGIKELKREYLIISLYMLIRHLRKHYVIDDSTIKQIKEFYLQFHDRWKNNNAEDTDMVTFITNRQQSISNLQVRDMVFRQLFFDYCNQTNFEILAKDTQRAFSEAQRIKIYRRDKGLCQQCLAENKPEKECRVSWSQYQADHIFPYAKVCQTITNNGQVLCQHHNAKKGAKVEPINS